MEKGALLPLRFYPGRTWQDYEKVKHYSGTPGISYVKEHDIFLPAFQMTMPDEGRHWGVLDFTTVEAIEVDTGGTVSLLQAGMKPLAVYNKAGDIRSLVWFRFPITNLVASVFAGRYYYHVSDGNTHWYSEVFDICDLETNALSEEFDNEAGWGVFGSTYTAGKEMIEVNLCKTATGAGDATAYTDITAYLGEEFDFYILTQDYNDAGCAGEVDWNAPVYFQLRDADGLAASEVITVDTTDTYYNFTLKATIGGDLRLYVYMDDADNGKAGAFVWLQRRYTDNHIQLRYSNGVNTCKIFYEDGYENVFFLDSKQVLDQNAIEENVVEDDEANKYRIIGTNQKWNDIQFASGEAMLNAMSLLRLHDNIKIIRETGEVMDIVEVLLEQSVLDYEASLIKLVYREESCSVEACGFEDCCPTLDTPIMQNVYSGVGVLPVAGAGNNGWYAMVSTAAGQYRIYLSNGAAWAVDTTYDVANDCVEARQNTETTLVIRFFWFDNSVSRWRHFQNLDAVNDNADGTADLVSSALFRAGTTIRGEYQDADGVWHECTDQVDVDGSETLITFSSIPGVGTWDFRLHVFTADCDYGYTKTVTQTIT